MPFWMQQLIMGGVLRQEANGEGSDLGGAEAHQEQEAQEEGKVKEDESEIPNEDAKANKPTDAEAKLLKELMKRKESEKATKAELDTLKKSIDGLDLEEMRSMIAEKKAAEEKALEAKGDYERIKQRMAEEHQKQVSEMQAKIDSLQLEKSTSEQRVNDLTIGTSFAHSAFVGEELVLPSAKARALYGQHFEVEDGKVVGYDQPRGSATRTALVDAYGQPLTFDEAMRKIIESDPEKDHLMRAKVRQGAGSNSNPKGSKGKVFDKELTGQEKIQQGLNGLLAKKA
jgi:hypothetical protein